MEMQVIMTDALTPFIDKVIAEKPQWMGSALKSAGFWAKKEIDAGIRSTAPGGQQYQALMPASKRRELDDAMIDPTYKRHGGRQNKRHPQRTYKHMGALAKAVKYDKTKVNQGVVTVGWTSRSAVRLGSWQEKGIMQPVTDKMRKLFFAAGIGMRAGTSAIKDPARPTYQAMQPLIKRGAPERVQAKIIEYLNGVAERSAARSRRVYRVYS